MSSRTSRPWARPCWLSVLVERLDWFTVNDTHADLHVVGVFEFDDEGKIISWRDYYNSAEITAKVGSFKLATTVQMSDSQE